MMATTIANPVPQQPPSIVTVSATMLYSANTSRFAAAAPGGSPAHCVSMV
jgi:hypothetical protein